MIVKLGQKQALMAALLAGALGSVPSWAADFSGKWALTLKIQERVIERQAELKQMGEKLTGTVSGGETPTAPIQDGAVKGDTLTFVVIREQNGQKLPLKFEGKLEGELVKGQVKVNREGQEFMFPWEAKRVVTPALAGKWRSNVKGPNGEDAVLAFDFKLAGEKVTGTLIRDGDTTHELTEGKFAGGEVSFLVVADSDGNKIEARFTGKLSGDTITGKINLVIAGEKVTLDWEAKRQAS